MKYVSETVSSTELIFKRLAIIPIVNEVQSVVENIRTFAGYIRNVNETVAIVENIIKNLQYGLVKQSRTGRIFEIIR